ncbi:MAG: phosphoribosylglycinamide formyltransferase [Gemmatimonadetes bacterium]|nr:phosphoribosylglycinamide formyltransferase [Gemmatimonadota bacterium]
MPAALSAGGEGRKPAGVRRTATRVKQPAGRRSAGVDRVRIRVMRDDKPGAVLQQAKRDERFRGWGGRPERDRRPALHDSAKSPRRALPSHSTITPQAEGPELRVRSVDAPARGVYLAALANPHRSIRLPSPARVAVLASGGGSNLQALVDRFHGRPDAAARVELVVGGRAGIGALERAARAGIDQVVLDGRALGAVVFAQRLLEELEVHGIDLVVLAGWLQLVPAEVVARFRGRMLNVHPALLPAFGGHGMYGGRVHRAVIASGARVSGATVHLVDDRYDEGRIIAQWPVPVLPGDTPETLAARVLAVEHRVLPLAVEAVASGISEEVFADPAAFELVSAPAPADASILAILCVPSSPDAPAGD